MALKGSGAVRNHTSSRCKPRKARTSDGLMSTQHMLGNATGVGVLVVLLLIAVSVERHPASVQETGSGCCRLAPVKS